MRSNLGMGLVLMASTVMVAQAPLIKPGLWEMTTVRNSGDGSPLKGKARICVAAADREKIVRPDMPNIPGCTLNVAKGTRGYTFDLTCTGKMQWQGHGSTTIVDAEHIEQELGIEMVVNGATHRQVDRISYHFVSAECGAVKPGDRPQIVE